MKHISIFLTLFCLSIWKAQAATNCTCGVTSDGQRIYGGREAVQNKYTWMVSLFMTTDGSSGYVCGASIITPRHILTAAHCTIGFTPAQIFATIGDHNKTTITETPTLQVTNMIEKYEHAAYNNTIFTDDISLLVSGAVIQYSNTVGPICLPTSFINTNYNVAKILGWGTTQSGTLSDVLKEGDVVVVPNSLCRFIFGFTAVTNNQQCIFNPVAGVCAGDSGGPTMLWNSNERRYTAIGIHSYKRGATCDALYPTVNTYVPAYIDWIQARIQDSRSLTDLAGSDVRTCSIV